ncbi:hypothetical protein V496_10244, partial [Pseudogymnoascus sp. VKM F-4515 (FW-2607)]
MQTCVCELLSAAYPPSPHSLASGRWQQRLGRTGHDNGSGSSGGDGNRKAGREGGKQDKGRIAEDEDMQLLPPLPPPSRPHHTTASDDSSHRRGGVALKQSNRANPETNPQSQFRTRFALSASLAGSVRV